jgi:hypothetical protein
MNRRAALSSLMLIVPTFAGCVHAHQVHPSELAKLEDSDRAAMSENQPADAERDVKSDRLPPPVAPPAGDSSPRSLRDLSGEPIALKPGVKLFALLHSGSKIGGDVSTTAVDQGQFVWRESGKPEVKVPLEEIKSAEVDVPDPKRTAGLVLLVIALTGLAVGASLFWAAGLSHQSGRPLRIRGEAITAAPCETSGWLAMAPSPSTANLSEGARAALAAAWLRDARDEHASVPAFSRLSLTLVALGAPSRLVEATHRAAIEEIEHARRVFALAAAYARHPIGPGALPELLGEGTDPRQVDPASAVRQLAIESVLDGCLGEGFAAALARESQARSTDPAVRLMLTTIARDEASHAELSWEILGWCLKTGGEETRAAVRAEIERLPRRIKTERVSKEIESEMEAHGRLVPDLHETIYQQVRTATVTRAALLLDQPGRQ